MDVISNMLVNNNIVFEKHLISMPCTERRAELTRS